MMSVENVPFSVMNGLEFLDMVKRLPNFVAPMNSAIPLIKMAAMRVTGNHLEVVATDRYVACRFRFPIEGAVKELDGVTMLLPVREMAAMVASMKRSFKGLKSIPLYVDLTAQTLTLGVLGDFVFRLTEDTGYPNVWQLVDWVDVPPSEVEWHCSPLMLGAKQLTQVLKGRGKHDAVTFFPKETNRGARGPVAYVASEFECGLIMPRYVK